MANFRGEVHAERGNRPPSTTSRLSQVAITAEAQSWDGKICTRLFKVDGVTMCEITYESHQGTGPERTHRIYFGPLTSIPEKL